jgi:hypothetical protein
MHFGLGPALLCRLDQLGCIDKSMSRLGQRLVTAQLCLVEIAEVEQSPGKKNQSLNVRSSGDAEKARNIGSHKESAFSRSVRASTNLPMWWRVMPLNSEPKYAHMTLSRASPR